jgi:succinate dehydrogenase hydrophobic anchor subunit
MGEYPMPPFTAPPRGKITRITALALVLLATVLLGCAAASTSLTGTAPYPAITIFVGSG